MIWNACSPCEDDGRKTTVGERLRVNLDPLGILASVDANWLLLSLIPNGVGFVLFVYGKKQGRTPQLVAGIILMVYPMIATTVTSLIVGGVLTTAGLWYALHAGW